MIKLSKFKYLIRSLVSNRKSDLLITAILIVFSIFALRALLHPGFYTSHDGWHIVARLYHFDQALRDGQFPVRWSGQLLGGFGYPLFIFSYQLPWFFAEPLVLSGLDIFTSLKLVFLITYCISGLTMYLWINRVWGKMAGFISAFLYLFTPYRFVNILARANLGEAVSFLFIPLIFLALFQLSKKPNVRYIIIGSLGLAGLILSHMLAAPLFLLPLALFTLLQLYFARKPKEYLLQVFLMLLLGIGLAAYYLLPALYYKPLTVFNDFYHGLYLNHFTPISKLLYCPWGYGAIGTPGEISRQVGLVLWMTLVISVILMIVNFFKYKRKTSLLNQTQIMGVIFVTTFLIAIFLMTKQSLFFWKMIEPYTLIDFPWRYLAVTTFSGSVLGGYIVSQIQGWKKVVIFGFIIILAVYTNRNHFRVNQYTDIPLSLYVASETTTNTDDEYLPKWVDRAYAKKENMPLIDSNEIQLKNIIRKTNRIFVDYHADKNSTINIFVMYFPGWNVQIDDVKLPVTKGDKGNIKLDLPSGNHQLEFKYIPTPIMRMGELVSLMSIFIIFWYTINIVYKCCKSN